MINHYTANRKVRNDDAYSPGGQIGRRPDRATLAYCQRAREASRGVPVIAGGVEASLRRLAHYDYWSDKVRRSILLDCKADLLVFGMGEAAIVEIAHRLAAGETRARPARYARRGLSRWARRNSRRPTTRFMLPSYEQVTADKRAFAEMTKIIHNETNPYNARRLVQYHDREAVVANPPALPLSAGGDGPRLRPAVHAQAASRLSRPADSGLRDGQGLGARSCAAASAAARSARSPPTRGGSSKAAARNRSWAKSARWRPTRTSKASSATSAARRPTCTRCAARGPRSRPSAAA